MFNGKRKAVTFSYDDGVTQDIRLIELFDKYNLKCTFNLNSGLMGIDNNLLREGRVVKHNHIPQSDIRAVYQNHEVAAHTLTHPFLPDIEDENEIIRQVECDRLKLSEIVGYEVVGMAYPGGGINNDDRVAEIIKNHTGVKYSRTTTSTYTFDIQSNLYRFNPTVYHHPEFDKMLELAEKFVNSDPATDQIFYIWGHAYEFDIYENWDKMEEFLKYISGRDDIFYGTNTEILLNTKEEENE